MIPGAPVAERLVLALAEQTVMPLLDIAVVPSRFMQRALVRRGMAARVVRRVPLAPVVDGRVARASRSQRRHVPEGDGIEAQDAAKREHTVRLLTVANWSPAKGIHRVLTALRSTRDLQWHWTLIGEWQNAYGRELRRTMQAGLAEDRVTVMSSVVPDQLQDVYDAADLFVLPSQMESYGLVFAEALTFGLPALALRAAAVPEVLGDAAILVRAGDDHALASELRALIEDARLRQELARRAAERGLQLPDWDSTRDALKHAVLGGCS
jgi:glycosyltransferase involved in cell wall biosynthesis